MNFSTDGFNERTNYIHNSNDLNRLNSNGPSNIDNSFAKMSVEERKDLVETTNNETAIVSEEVRGDKDKFIVRNNNMNRVNKTVNPNNPVANALNRNMFKR